MTAESSDIGNYFFFRHLSFDRSHCMLNVLKADAMNQHQKKSRNLASSLVITQS